MVLFKILVLGLLDWQVLRSLILQTKIYVMGGCHILGGVCQLAFLLEELSQQGMKSLNNQTAQLVGTSWD